MLALDRSMAGCSCTGMARVALLVNRRSGNRRDGVGRQVSLKWGERDRDARDRDKFPGGHGQEQKTIAAEAVRGKRDLERRRAYRHYYTQNRKSLTKFPTPGHRHEPSIGF